MSIFGTIMSKIFGSDHPASQTSAPPAQPSDAPPTQPAGTNAGTTADAPQAAPPTVPSSPSPETGGATGTGPTKTVDVAEVLDGMSGHAGQKLDWRHSIVDLMKLLGMDSSLSARKELAHELHYTGDTNDSASMNIWLHKQVMTKFAENGGKLPSDLQH